MVSAPTHRPLNYMQIHDWLEEVAMGGHPFPPGPLCCKPESGNWEIGVFSVDVQPNTHTPPPASRCSDRFSSSTLRDKLQKESAQSRNLVKDRSPKPEEVIPPNYQVWGTIANRWEFFSGLLPVSPKLNTTCLHYKRLTVRGPRNGKAFLSFLPGFL